MLCSVCKQELQLVGQGNNWWRRWAHKYKKFYLKYIYRKDLNYIGWTDP